MNWTFSDRKMKPTDLAQIVGTLEAMGIQLVCVETDETYQEVEGDDYNTCETCGHSGAGRLVDGHWFHRECMPSPPPVNHPKSLPEPPIDPSWIEHYDNRHDQFANEWEGGVQ